MNKIQIRAEVFATLNNFSPNAENNENSLTEMVERISKIEDKDFLARLLIKEFISTQSSEKSALISLLLLNCVPVENLESNLWSNLALKTISDKKKYQLLDLLKSLGKFIEYDKYLDYFEEPQAVIEMDTHKLLMTAMLNPEAQIDFLDFLATLDYRDKMLLINSMGEDYTADDLANILFPIILYEKNKEILELVITSLIGSKSPLAYFPLKRFSELSKDENLLKLVSRGLKELKIAGVTEEKAKEYYKNRFNNSILYLCHASLVDGQGNQGLMFSRIRNDNSIQLFCTVINDLSGIIDCFGFNCISQMEFSLILKKFYGKQSPIQLTFETGLSWLNEAEKISFEKNKSVSYEYACWKEILFDVNEVESYTEDTISKALSLLPPQNFDMDELLSTEYLDKMYFQKNEHDELSKLILNIDEVLTSQEKIDLTSVEKLIQDNITTVYDDEIKALVKKRLAKNAFCLMSSSKMNYASMIFQLIESDDYFKDFLCEMTKKSIFEFYKEIFQNRFKDNADNIFVRHAIKNNSGLDNIKLKDLLEEILDKWGRDD